MSTDLAVFTPSSFLSLADGSEVAEAMTANMATGETLDASLFSRVKTPSGGGTTWTIPGVAGDEETKEVRGLLVGLFVRGVLWPSEEPAADTLPVLSTDDLRIARIVGEVPASMRDEIDRCKLADGTVDWQKLTYTQFGSGKGGFGKRAKEQRVLFILRETDNFPVVVTVQPGSLKVVRPFIAKLPVPHWRAVVSLTLEKVVSRGGQPYARVMPKLVGELNREHGERARLTWTEPLKKIVGKIALDAEPVGGDDE